MTNGQSAVMLGVKVRLDFISDREVTLTKEELQGHKNWILDRLKFYIEEYNSELDGDMVFAREPKP